MKNSHSTSSYPSITPREGWHVLHLFFQIDGVQWGALSAKDRANVKSNLSHLVEEIQSSPETQIVILSIVGGKADLGFMLTCPDLQVLDKFAKRLSLGLRALKCVFSWLSMTELSEYTMSEAEYAENLKPDLSPDSPEFETKLIEFRTRIEKYNKDRLYPQLAEWPVFCFYPMSKRRAPAQNWYSLDFECRKKLMAGHARVGRTYAGKVRQLITGATGLDDGEWGVTLFAHTTSDIKAIVYEMRFDPVSAEFADFGKFFIGLQLPLEEVLARAFCI